MQLILDSNRRSRQQTGLTLIQSFTATMPVQHVVDFSWRKSGSLATYYYFDDTGQNFSLVAVTLSQTRGGADSKRQASVAALSIS